MELVRSASWEVPQGEVLDEVPAEVLATLKKEVVRGREELTRTILDVARKLMPQYGIELVDMRIKRLDYVESVREKVYTRMISERKRIAAEFRSEGEGRSAEIRGTMEKELRQIRSLAYRQVQEIQGKVDAEATRCELLISRPGLGESISGAILYDETIRQSTRSGIWFVGVMAKAGIVSGIKVDTGAKDLAGHPVARRQRQ